MSVRVVCVVEEGEVDVAVVGVVISHALLLLWMHLAHTHTERDGGLHQHTRTCEHTRTYTR